DAARIHPRHAVPREEAVDGDRGADLERVAPPAAALKLMRRAELRAPVRDLPAVGIANVEVDPDMRIRPFDFSDDAVELDRLVGIELRGERVMSGSLRRQEGERNEQARDDPSAHVFLLLLSRSVAIPRRAAGRRPAHRRDRGRAIAPRRHYAGEMTRTVTRIAYRGRLICARVQWYVS